MAYKITLESDVDILNEEGEHYSALHAYHVPEVLWKQILTMITNEIPSQYRMYVPT